MPNDEKMRQDLTSHTQNKIASIAEVVAKVQKIWQEIGMDLAQQLERTDKLFDHLNEILLPIEIEEDNLLQYFASLVQSHTKDIERLSDELQQPVPEVVEAPLLQKEETLRKQLNSLKDQKQQRLRKYNALNRIQQDYCQKLKMPEHKIASKTGCPTEQDLHELEVHLSMLKVEKEKRYQKFCMLKRELTTIWEHTELAPETEFEKGIISGEEEKITLSEETFKSLESVISKAQAKKLELEEQRRKSIEKLHALWVRLEVGEDERQKFLEQHTDCTTSILGNIQKEIKRLEDLKQQNAESYLVSLRKELQELWETCLVAVAERQLFHPFFSNDFTEENIAAHEKEIENWKSYFSGVQHIITKIEDRHKLWQLMLKLEAKVTDPNRFKNRGGNLLREEKDRRKLQKDLPALEKNICEAIDIYEKSGNQFHYYETDFRTFVANQLEEHTNLKENKKVVQQKKYLAVPNNVALATPGLKLSKCVPKSAPSPISHSKRHNGVTRYQSPAAAKRKIFPATSVKKKISKVEAKPLAEANSPTLETISYSVFANELNRTSRNIFRSSVTRLRTRRKPIPQSSHRKRSTKSIKESDESEDSTEDENDEKGIL